MRYFYDLEFLEDGRTIDLLSIGIAAEDGREYYACNLNAEIHRLAREPWLMKNVVPQLPIDVREAATISRFYLDWREDVPELVKPHRVIAQEVEEFISAGSPDRADNELWAYYAAYDHVALCQLWGRMLQLPASVPMFTNDIQSLVHFSGLGRGEVPSITKMVPQEDEHHALADARWNFAAWRFLVKHAAA